MSVNRTKIRCAIYTRKSHEEGLEQEFNSLDAQRQSSEAYIESQRHEGWQCLEKRYDDGGFSGGTMQRPALDQLLDDICAERIDCVVVYKVDRLSRSLLDFAQLVALFDEHKVSFVSVTQQFNTTTSMGRLTLNILLSFAQFEREIIGERIRDKKLATAQQGKYIGGQPVLGLDIIDRKYVVNRVEEKLVRRMFQLFLELESCRKVAEALNAEGIVTKKYRTKTGKDFGGKPWKGRAVYDVLTDKKYIGQIVHKDKAYAGEHAAIVKTDLFERVQATLTRQQDLHPQASGQAIRVAPTHAAVRRVRQHGPAGVDQQPRSTVPLLHLLETHQDRLRQVQAANVARRRDRDNGRRPAARLAAAPRRDRSNVSRDPRTRGDGPEPRHDRPTRRTTSTTRRDTELDSRRAEPRRPERVHGGRTQAAQRRIELAGSIHRADRIPTRRRRADRTRQRHRRPATHRSHLGNPASGRATARPGTAG